MWRRVYVGHLARATTSTFSHLPQGRWTYPQRVTNGCHFFSSTAMLWRTSSATPKKKTAAVTDSTQGHTPPQVARPHRRMSNRQQQGGPSSRTSTSTPATTEEPPRDPGATAATSSDTSSSPLQPLSKHPCVANITSRDAFAADVNRIRSRREQRLHNKTFSSKINSLAHSMRIGPTNYSSSSLRSFEQADDRSSLLNPMSADRGVLRVRHFRSEFVEWIDVVSQPTVSLNDYRNGIALFLMELGVHETVVESTMESVLLPQTTMLNDCASIVLRSAVSDTTADMDSIQELTNRLTVIVLGEKVLTIHRPEMKFLTAVRDEWDSKYTTLTRNHLVNLIVKRCVKTYQEALAQSIVLFDQYESKLFVPQKQRSQLARHIYHIKRRASVYSRVLALQFESYAHLASALQVPKYDIYFQDVAQHIAHVRSLSEELNDNANAVLQLLFQLSSYQLNELMRVLTMFSAFFIPLTFITGVYGMNFENLPGLHSDVGPLFCFAVMGAISGGLLVWFRLKGFW